MNVFTQVAVGLGAAIASIMPMQCSGGSSTTPTYMPANAPYSVKQANNCIPQRNNTMYILVGGGQGWWIAEGRDYNWSTGQYGGYTIYGWSETQASTCPNSTYIGYIYQAS